MDTVQPVSILQLPDPCLLAVLQFCASDHVSLANAARAHSRLHQAAVLALSSITAYAKTQQQADSLVMYLSKHGLRVDSLVLMGPGGAVKLVRLPANLRLRTLKIKYMTLQLQPGSGCQGIVQPGFTLERLQLYACTLLDGAEGLAAALTLLPGLQQLIICGTKLGRDDLLLQTDALSGLQQLTHLEIDDVELQGPDEGTPALQPLQSLTRLVDLRLAPIHYADLSSSVLSALQQLTHLGLAGGARLEPVALAALTRLQHLDLAHATLLGPAAGAAQLLSQLQDLQQLTHLNLSGASSLTVYNEGDPPAAAFSALTASSNLQHLYIRHCKLPAAVWQHMFPAGRQLPHLQALDVSYVTQPDGTPAAAPEGTRLVSCCPGLQALIMQRLQYSEELLAPLQRLSGLHSLVLSSEDVPTEQGLVGKTLEAVGRLTGLKELDLHAPCPAEVLLQQLTQLKQLTRLVCIGSHPGVFVWQADDREPVWRQVLRHLLSHSNQEVPQQAAAALAE